MDTLSEKPAGLAETYSDRKEKLNDHEDEIDYKTHEAILAEAMEDSASPELSAEVRLRNPLLGYSPAQIEARVQHFALKPNLRVIMTKFLTLHRRIMRFLRKKKPKSGTNPSSCIGSLSAVVLQLPFRAQMSP